MIPENNSDLRSVKWIFNLLSVLFFLAFSAPAFAIGSSATPSQEEIKVTLVSGVEQMTVEPFRAAKKELDFCTPLKFSLAPETCSFEYEGVSIACDECNFVLQTNENTCELEKVLESADDCRVTDTGSTDIPVVIDP